MSDTRLPEGIEGVRPGIDPGSNPGGEADAPPSGAGSRLDDRYLNARAQQYAEKSAFGGMSLGSRISLFFFLGALAAAGFAVLFLQVDRRVSAAVDEWREAQRVAQSLATIERSVGDIRVLDRRFTADPSPATAQALQRALNTTGRAVEALGSITGDADISDAIVTVRDGFAQYSSQFSAYVDRIEEAGYSDDAGLRGERNAMAQDVRAKLKVIGLALSVPDFDLLHASDPANLDNDPYAALRQRIQAVLAEDEAIAAARDAAVRALDRHQALTARLAELAPVLAEGPAAASDIIDYIAPSLRVLSEYSAELGRRAPARFEAERQRARQLIAGGSAAILFVLVLAGIVLMRSMSAPVQRLSFAAGRLAEGDRSVSIPVRGNSDAAGRIARALDAWLDNLTEIDHLRAEIDDLRLRLVAEAELRTAAERATAAIPEAERPESPTRDPAVASPGKDASMLPIVESPAAVPDGDKVTLPPPLPEATETPSRRSPASFGERDDDASRGTSSPIGSASQELTRFSEFVNDATRDVERTETLMRQLGDTARQIADLEQCVETIRDEAHLLVFRSPGGTLGGPDNFDDDTLVYLSGDAKRPDGEVGAKRFDTIRDAVDRAERLVVSVRRSLDSVTDIAQEIATNASAEALEATNKLLSQSEYLQNMLDDLVHKMKPAASLGDGSDQNGNSRTRRDGDR